MRRIETIKAPKAIGPYSQAIVAGNFIFCSGQLPLDPATRELVAGGIGKQTERALQNLAGVLEAAGANFSTVTSVNVYLRSMSDFKEMNDVYVKAFGKHKPARATVGVSELPKNARIEISCVAYLSK